MQEGLEKFPGLFYLSDWGHVEILGPDSADFLNRMSTVNIKTVTPSKMAHGALLTGRGHVLALGFLQMRDAQAYEWILSPGQNQKAAEHLEKFHFQERLTVSDVSRSSGLFGIWNPAWNAREPLGVFSFGGGTCWRDDSRTSLYWLNTPTKAVPSELKNFGPLEKSLWEYLRIEKAVPQVGVEISENEIILETNFDRSVARNKGCYPGQEVVERIFTYGSVNKKLLPVEFETSKVELPQPLSFQNTPAGSLVSAVSIPTSPEKSIGLAYIQRNFWESQEFLTQSGVRVRLRQII